MRDNEVNTDQGRSHRASLSGSVSEIERFHIAAEDGRLQLIIRYGQEHAKDNVAGGIVDWYKTQVGEDVVLLDDGAFQIAGEIWRRV